MQSTSSAETESLGEKIGRRLKGGEVIELISDIGGGKTTFVRGLAKGIGSQDAVSSPTFTVEQQYRAKNLTLHHFDFYRLSEPGVIQHELQEVIDDKRAVVVIEWSDIVQGVLPEQRLVVRIKPTGETSRDVSFAGSSKLSYVFEGVN